MQIGILIFASFSFAYFSGTEIVGADVQKCCLETNNGAFCQDLENSEECKSSLLSTSCEKTTNCKQVCCYDSEQGLCYPRSPIEMCVSKGGIQNQDATCNNLPECVKGCCVLGEGTEFVTQKRCEVRAEQEGFGVDFQRGISEAGCLELAKQQKEGACVYENSGVNVCEFTTEAGCMRANGNFSVDVLCTNSALNTDCEPTQTTNCFEGKDGVYFVDSCGNRANIYDSTKVNDEDYWSTVVGVENSCGDGNGNLESDVCGNCDYELGSFCGIGAAKYGGRICKNLNCPDAASIVDSFGKILKKQNRANGETWCVYDGSVDNGTDVVGSRHWRYYCLNGDVKIEPCSDYRQEVCGKKVVEGEVVEGIAEEAEQVGCFVNRWRECVNINNQLQSKINSKDEEGISELKKSCEDIGQCVFYEMTLAKTPIIPMCLPRFPGGLNFWEYGNKTEAKERADSTCSVATSIPYIGTCTKVTKCGCKSGCDCGTEKWLEEANKICASFGDCGAYVSIDGEITTDGYDSTMGENEQQGGKLNSNYLNSLKELVNKLPEKEIEIEYFGDGNSSFADFSRYIIPHFNEDGDDEGGGFLEDFFAYVLRSATFGLMGGKECKTKITYYHYECLPWQAPVGGEDCSKCNDLENGKKCSEYRCKSLGQGCEFLNQGTGNELCSWIHKDDRTAPVISPWEDVLINASYEEQNCASGDCYKIKGDEKECLEPYTNYALGILADEPAQCKIEINSTSGFENMTSWLENNYYLTQHYENISFISPGHIYEIFGLNLSKDFDFYIRCRDKNGNENEDEMKISLCVDSGEDENIPRVVRTYPENDGYLEYGLSEVDVNFYINEPSECKWDFADKPYDAMDNDLECVKEIEYPEADFTYSCNTTLMLTDTTYYVKCKDQPWLGNSDERNVMDESYVYHLNPSESELKIVQMSPEGDKEVPTNPATITLQVETSGGAEDGKAFCEFSSSSWQGFYETDSKFHKQEGFSVSSGRHKIPVRCKDAGGNVVEEEMNFKIIPDTSSPQIARIYVNGGNIKFITTENADCKYSTSSCGFNFDSGSSAGSATEHSLPLTANTYFIKCADEHGNKPSGCSIEIRGVNYI